jgi:hypothetical protein
MENSAQNSNAKIGHAMFTFKVHVRVFVIATFFPPKNSFRPKSA